MRWGSRTDEELIQVEKPVDLHEVRYRLLDAAAEAEPTFRALAVSTSAYDVTIECTTWTTTGSNGWTAQATTSEHYQQHVRAELHGMINEGRPVAECATHARRRIPWWTSNDIANELTDRSTDPLLRSYLWTYPAGIDWFVVLADTADETTIGRVLRGRFERPPPRPTWPRSGRSDPASVDQPGEQRAAGPIRQLLGERWTSALQSA